MWIHFPQHRSHNQPAEGDARGWRTFEGERMTTAGPLSVETIDSTDELIRLGDGGPVPDGANVVAVRRFEEVARRSPELTAVVYYDETLSYGELDARANAMAARL